MINLTQQQLEIVKNILHEYVPDAEVRAFGSRVTNKVKAYSDLDLVVLPSTKLDLKILYRLRDAFEESELPFRVDVLDWYRITDSFKKIINQHFHCITQH